ncbi:TetR/AcrR family transcriptional regulator [Jiella avicenniae]|uniref:TetR/AcrR family transcriptional regulator n=1 Tax=Jiella avicenniae TaxID=2907202 RepID=A0A9X1P5S2_9HYPH|nr:TetR/AcrR family transcriptional regulator [Jiella avicenniae]MCE7029721.1 TetR/AcrR family transcriptional regulator [Jiella avicenniae]
MSESSARAITFPVPPAPATAQEQRRQQILDAARVCFARSGFHSASMHQICAEAQMSPGALYRYFPSKDSIIEAIAEEERVTAAACAQLLFEPGDLVERIVQVGVEYLKHTRDRATGGLTIEIWSESIRNTAVGQRFCEIEAGIHASLRTMVFAARDRGEIDPDADVDAALTLIFALADGLVLRLQLQPEISIDSIEPQLRKFVRGLLAPKADAPVGSVIHPEV